MGILDKSRTYKISGAKLNAPTPPRIVNVHLKSHVYLSDVNNEAILESSSELEDTTRQHEENSVSSRSSDISLSTVSSSITTNEGTVTESQNSISGEMSLRQLTFRLAFPKAMRNMLMSSRCKGNRSSSLPCELGEDSMRQFSDICLSNKKDRDSFSRRQSFKNALQSRRGSWCTNATVNSIETGNQQVWPGGRFLCYPDRTYSPLPKNKVEVIWNDNYSLNRSTLEEKTPLTVTNGSNFKGSQFPCANSDQSQHIVATPSPLPCSNKPKVSKFMSKCCM